MSGQSGFRLYWRAFHGAAVPEAGRSIDAMARIRGIAVIPAVDEGLIARGARADRLRGATAEITGRLRAITSGNSDEEGESLNEVG